MVFPEKAKIYWFEC